MLGKVLDEGAPLSIEQVGIVPVTTTTPSTHMASSTINTIDQQHFITRGQQHFITRGQQHFNTRGQQHFNTHGQQHY